MSARNTNLLDRIERESVRHAVQAIAEGRIIIVIDDADRENEGDFVCAGALTTPDMVNLMVTRGRGLVCLAVPAEVAERLELVPQNGATAALHGTNFTVSVDATEGTTTGISAADRAKTIQVLSDPEATPDQLARPGHMFPIIANPGGLAVRRGHTEAAVWLSQVAGIESATGVICEIMAENGEMAGGKELRALAEELDMPLVHVDDIASEAKRLNSSGSAPATGGNHFGADARMQEHERTLGAPDNNHR
ncbi:MAG: 3,4-dihydroxy-2-butanone-4-phosphate synthase [Spirochaetales bacterium]